MDPPRHLAQEVADHNVTLRRGKLIPWLGGFFSRMGKPAAAVTLGKTIVLYRGVPLTDRLLRHELAHVRQWRDPLFPFRYTVATLRYGYRSNPYEVEARMMETSAPPAAAAEERTV